MKRSCMTRREFLATAAGAALAVKMSSCSPRRRQQGRFKTVIVLGVDGMDPVLLERFMQAGMMPTCRRLAEQGAFRRLATTTPPQSPVAWASFASGTGPGGHGIFDFIARDPASLIPYFAGSRVVAPEHNLQIGSMRIPLGRTRQENMRRGPTFWVDLADHGIPCVVSRMPVSFPPTPCRGLTLSGLGTPDLRGTYGIFTFLTDNPDETTREVAGGCIEKTSLSGNAGHALLRGPSNAQGTPATQRIDIFVDPVNAAAKVVLGESTSILREGEWSGWIPVQFADPRAAGMCRLYLQRARQPFGLYVSPVNLDPRVPAVPISTPEHYAAALARAIGRFHTQGMPEDTRALSAGVFSDNEYRHQALDMLGEQERLFEYQLDTFMEGFFFFYFSTLDLNSHAFWRTLDTGHPLYTTELAAKHGDFLPSLYRRIDRAVARALARQDDKTLVLVLSDHGFGSFRRQFNLNRWLLENGYLVMRDSADTRGMFGDVDWSRTRAYGFGINSLYLNLVGREPNGCVKPGIEADAVANRLATELESVVDAHAGERVMAHVYQAPRVYSGPHAHQAPDLVLGYGPNHRASWKTVLGGTEGGILEDNLDPWSGDHAMDASFLPGILLSSQPVPMKSPAIWDLAPSILSGMGIPIPAEMTGQNIFV